MISLLPFFVSGAVLAVALVLLVRVRGEIGRNTTCEEAEATLNALRGELLASGLVMRILDPSDFEYVTTEGDGEIRRQFEQERKNLAILWLRRTREHVDRLFAFHLRVARQDRELSPRVELRLALSYLVFVAVYAFIVNSIRVAGPLRAREAFRLTTLVASELCQASGNLLAKLDPSRAETVEETPTNLSAAS